MKLIASLIVMAGFAVPVATAEPDKPYKTYAIQKGQKVSEANSCTAVPWNSQGRQALQKGYVELPTEVERHSHRSGAQAVGNPFVRLREVDCRSLA